jgi:hypothetical protein
MRKPHRDKRDEEAPGRVSIALQIHLIQKPKTRKVIQLPASD